MNKIDFNTKIWDYYLMLEDQFIDTFKYVEPGPINDSKNINKLSFSKMYNQLLLSVGSEVDILLKELCKIAGDTKADKMEIYKKVLKDYKNFSNEGCKYIYDSEVIYPWINFKEEDSPDWWTNYNNLKHRRLKNKYFKLGNYKNVTQALAGLFIICRVLYREFFLYEPSSKSKIFKMYNWDEYIMIGDDPIFYSTSNDLDSENK